MNRKTQYLLQSLSAGKIYMSRSVADAYMFSLIEALKNPDYKGFLEDTETPEQKEQAALRFIASYSQDAQPYISDKWYRYPPFVVQGVLVIPVSGIITQDSYWGETSTKNIMSWYEKAKNDPEILGVLEVGNSPGGAVFGTRELATYKESYPKPKVTLVEGLCASAYMYISAPADKILATSASAILGSIGVMTTYANFKKYYEAMGIEVKDVYSIGSPQKNYAYREAEKGNFKPLEEGVLFQLDNQFTSFVKAYRPGLSKRAIQGADMTAEDAMKEGLLDDIATFDEAIQLVKSLANSYQPKVKTKTKMSKQYVIITSNRAVIASARTLQQFDASISIQEIDGEENDDNGNPPTHQPEEAGASASNQQQQAGKPAASITAPTPTPATANAQPDASASAQSPEDKIAAAVATALAPLQAKIVALEAHANIQVNASTPPVQNNQQLTATGQSDDELFTAVQQ